jgi:hypothetical protein
MARRDGKGQCKQMFSLVRGVINRWDPYTLLAGGAPEDEFENEVALVISRIKTIKTEKDAAIALSEVFSEAFEPENFTLEFCHQAGRDLFHELKKANFLSTSQGRSEKRVN